MRDALYKNTTLIPYDRVQSPPIPDTQQDKSTTKFMSAPYCQVFEQDYLLKINHVHLIWKEGNSKLPNALYETKRSLI